MRVHVYGTEYEIHKDTYPDGQVRLIADRMGVQISFESEIITQQIDPYPFDLPANCAIIAVGSLRFQHSLLDAGIVEEIGEIYRGPVFIRPIVRVLI